MADTKISALTVASTADSADAFVIARSGQNYQTTLTNLLGIPGAFTVDLRKVVVASSDLKVAFSTPYQIYPGSTSYQPVLTGRVTIRKLAGTAYTLNGNTTLVLERSSTDGTTVALLNITLTGFLDQTIERNYNWYGGGGATTMTSDFVVQATKLRFRLNTADMTVGSGNLEVSMVVEKHQLFYAFST